MTGSGTTSNPILGVFGLLTLFAFSLILISLPLRQITHTDEPLADPLSLESLIRGETLPQPSDATQAIFYNMPVTAPNLATLAQVTRILGITASPNTTKRIEVDLTRQKVYAYEDNIKVYEFTVSTGKWGRTPTGEFTIWVKVKSQLMSGGKKELGTYYYLPNVPWVMFFSNDDVAKMRGFSFHGTYWHDNFGHPMSHGCINMKTDEAKILYDWATPVVTNDKAWSTLAKKDNPGTRVIIYGETPTE